MSATTVQIGHPKELALAVQVARRYYLEEQSKVEIATAMNISRFRVARLLDMARTSGLVSIRIETPGAVNTELSDLLIERYGLKRAIAVDALPGDDAMLRDRLGETAARLLEEIVTADDVLGIGWARSVISMAAHIKSLPACHIVQLTGALSRPDVDISTTEVVRKLARLGGGTASLFYAPMFVSDPQTAEMIRKQSEMAEAFGQFSRVTKAVVGVGGWQPPASALYDALTSKERRLLMERGVSADLSGVFVDRHGQAMQMPLGQRTIGISGNELKAIPEVIAIAYGREKLSAVRTAIAGGFIHTLVVSTNFARALITYPAQLKRTRVGQPQQS
jgi:DNA-binding transcriptional regulator LsrR (DeoR family)